MSTPPRRPLSWLEPATKLGALVYAIAGGIIVWLLVDVLPRHIDIHITFH
ncbi:hypothetical protein [Actinomadura bangladeshensis]|uniref:Uncharacterized protein n=1 Tax=Actinomadura bangladeshensis TaxID=453573 RepID=A0A6L9Q906_9ACTN|nr:hypothetical protein [Actinomadura bangladeshensis]NEA21947.1 hypothetical protein [Actinomadura bangladeshensis]